MIELIAAFSQFYGNPSMRKGSSLFAKHFSFLLKHDPDDTFQSIHVHVSLTSINRLAPKSV